MASSPDYLDLYDYRRQVDHLYRERNRALDNRSDPVKTLDQFRRGRDTLFSSHRQSAIAAPARAGFGGLSYFPYDPDAVVEGRIDRTVEQSRVDVQTADRVAMPMVRACTVSFSLGGHVGVLSIFWIDVYGGGLFLPFVDATAPVETYGGGRYLFDTVKGSDFAWRGNDSTRIILDFNYSYNPSCAYDARWSCPLAPRENRLSFPIHAGEKRYLSSGGPA